MTTGRLDASDLLRRNLVFGQLDDAERVAVERELVPMSVPGGQLLFAHGEPADALYVLKSGSLGAFRTPEAGGAAQLVSLVAGGETIGAYGLLTRQPRTFDLRALRDSELLRLPREGFEALVQRHPEAILGAARQAMERLVEEQTHPPEVLPRTFAILPFDRHVEVRQMARQLCTAFSEYGECLLLDAATGRDHDASWFAEREHAARFVLYLDEGTDPEWRELCRRQADALLLVVNAGRHEAPWPDHAALDRHAAWERPRYLLLQHPDTILPGAAQRWSRSFTRPLRRHHVRGACRERDLARLARLLTRNSVGLVFSGGGARGFAALGMVRALREAGIEIDAVGGTSIGAIIGAGVALEWDDEAMHRACRHAFVDGRPLADRTVPLVALSRGRRTVRLLREAFGDVDIEDMPLAYFCMVSNLSTGRGDVHRDGRLWYWLRASSAIPGILPPVLHRGQVHVDGAVINNLPTDVMRDIGLGRIIACDISADDALQSRREECFLPPWWRVLMQSFKGMRPGLLPILTRVGMVNTEQASTHRRALTDHLLAPEVADIGLLEWEAFDRAVDAGYRHTRHMLEAGMWKDHKTPTMPT